MPETRTVAVPDIGEFQDVDVVELLVSPGDRIALEDPLITLESDKASMDVPSPFEGVVRELVVSVGDQVSEGDPICVLEVTEGAMAAPREARSSAPQAPRGNAELGDALRTEVLVLGAGPGGYTAAFRAADLGKQVVLVERYPALGGVCLNVGCIPSKALLHMAEVIEEAAAIREHGIDFGEPRIDLERVRARKDEVVGALTRGLASLAQQRRVRVLTGEGRFVGPHEIEVEGEDGTQRVRFEHAIVAAGSRAVELPGLPEDPRILDSTSALELEGVPERLLVVGGGIVGLEMATVYAAFGARVSVVELLDGLMVGADRDLVRPLQRRLKERLEAIWLATRVEAVEAREDALHVKLAGKGAPGSAAFDRVLVAVGRRPNGDRIGAEAAGLQLDERGFLTVDHQLRSNVAHIFAIGDVVGEPMLAHKATHEGKTAAEVIAGLPASFDARAIPSVAYTDPEVAWTGLTEEAAAQQGTAVRKAVFPWSASGRALGIGRPEGLTKLLFSEESGQLVGAGIVGPGAGDLIAEANLALEMGADALDLGMTIHPHPTLSETLGFAAELAAGTITDLLPPKKRA
ncbi:MAG: dihydrolipoyl dehydrogenase [Deltaproteobacteria bacterium]|nr:dihydrolipoyl dehydrogenase [Deltaproteobacteria bacterium]